MILCIVLKSMQSPHRTEKKNEEKKERKKNEKKTTVNITVHLLYFSLTLSTCYLLHEIIFFFLLLLFYRFCWLNQHSVRWVIVRISHFVMNALHSVCKNKNMIYFWHNIYADETKSRDLFNRCQFFFCFFLCINGLCWKGANINCMMNLTDKWWFMNLNYEW